MSAVATAIVGSAVVGAYSSNRASRAQSRSADNASAAELEKYYTAREDQMPWMGAGTSGLNQLSALLGIDAGPNQTEQNFNAARYLELNPDANEYMRTSGNSAYQHWIADGRRRTGDFWNTDPNAYRAGSAGFGSLNKPFTQADFQQDPGYQFRLAEGEKGINNSLAAKGGVLSGAAAKAMARFNQDYASGEFANAWNRDNVNKTNTFNRLASLAGVGQTSANQVGNQAMATGQSIGNNIMSAGNARASGYVGAANALTGAVGQGINMYQQNQLMNGLGGGYSGYINSAYSNGFGDAFTNMSNPAYG